MKTVTVVLLTILPAITLAQTHPHLLFEATDIPALRARKSTEPFAALSKIIQTEADSALEGSSDYTNGMRAVNAAFMYVLTGQQAWADRAWLHVDSIVNGSQWAKTTVKGLTLYMNGKSVALAYDMCHGAWSSAVRDMVSMRLRSHADIIRANGGTEQNTNAASNWQGIRFSAAGLCYLACDEVYDTAMLGECWTKVVRYCRENMGDGPASRGWNIEGIGYTTYPFGQFIGAFGIAMARRDASRDLRKQIGSVPWTAWTIYAAACRIRGNGMLGMHPDFGDDNNGLRGEGVFGMAFHYCPGDLIPGLRYWYDRIVGSKGDGSFDRWRHGAIYGYLYYPASVPEKDPMSIDLWRTGFVDTGGNGFMTYRNRYIDGDDMVAQIYLKLRGNKGHSGPDALSFRIFGLGTPFAVGGGRYGVKINGRDAYWSSMNTLYPMDPESPDLTTNGNSGIVVGTPYLRGDGAGHVISTIVKNNVGVDDHRRWFVADHSRSAGVEAVYVIGDRSTNGTFWQMCTIKPHAIAVDPTEKTFTISGSGGSSMKGWILYQAGAAAITSGTRVRGSGFQYRDTVYDDNNYVHLRSSDGDYLVVLTAAKSGQTHPRPAVTGTWPGPVTVKVGTFGVSIDGDAVSYAPSRAATRGRGSLRATAGTAVRRVMTKGGTRSLQRQDGSAIPGTIVSIRGRTVTGVQSARIPVGVYLLTGEAR